MAHSLAGVFLAMAFAGYGWLRPANPHSEGEGARGTGLAIAQDVAGAEASDRGPPREALARGVWGLRFREAIPFDIGASAKNVGVEVNVDDEPEGESTEEEDAEHRQWRKQGRVTQKDPDVEDDVEEWPRLACEPCDAKVAVELGERPRAWD